MSVKPYEVYLADQFLEWASQDIQAGFRYQFKSPDAQNALNLYQAFCSLSTESLSFEKDIQLSYIQCDGIKLIPVLHGNTEPAFSENFISHLRDEVASRSGIFEGSALLVIHNSMLDTLINSAKDLAADDAIWNPHHLKNKLGALIGSKNRELTQCLLDDELANILEDGATIFGFSSLYSALDDGELEFNELNLFDDPFIHNKLPKDTIRKRLDQNRKLRETIEFATEHFSDQLESSLKEFSAKFIKDNFQSSNNWRDLTLDQYLKEIKANKDQKLVFEELLVSCDSNGLFPLTRAKSQTKAGERELSVLLEVPKESQKLDLVFTFTGNDLEKRQVKIIHNQKLANEYSLNINRAGGKRSTATITIPCEPSPSFFSIEIKRPKRSEEYKFRFLILEEGRFLINEFKNCFRIEPQKKQPRLVIQQEENTLKLSERNETFELDGNGNEVCSSDYGSVSFEKLAEVSEEIQFNIKSNEHILPVYIEGPGSSGSLEVPLLFAQTKLKRLFNDTNNAEYNRTKRKVVFENSEYTLVGIRSSLLDMESHLIDNGFLSYNDQGDSITLDDLSSSFPNLAHAYSELFNYCELHNSLPSLSAWGSQYCSIVQELLNAYETELQNIELHQILSPVQKKLLQIGIYKNEGQEKLSPLHPLILTYHLQLVENIKKDIDEDGASSFTSLPPVTLERLVASGLMPFVYHESSNFAHVQPVKENRFWLNVVPQQNVSHGYVKKLVKDKLKEFTQAYSRLFKGGSESALTINAINQGFAKELFFGLVDHFKQLGDKATAIHVNFYDDQLQKNDFDKFADAGSFDKLKTWLGFNSSTENADAEILINLIRRRLTYSKFTTPKGNEKLAYAHLAFFKNNAPVDCRPVNMDTALSGVLGDGLIAGDAAELIEDSYFTSFGLRNIEVENFQTLRLAKLIGSMWQPARESNSPYNGLATGLAVSSGFRQLLNSSYESALWTTIIDPKVTLDFFTSQKDVVLIHYSDQYTSNTGYDAITVTKQIELFESLLQKDSHVGVKHLLEEFNAFNGEWLLKMLTSHEKDRKEKHGIIGAYKFVSSMLRHSDICWVPLSVAEIIRVSGNVGLKMNDSEFSRVVQGYKKGAISDDVLFVGFKGNALYLLPLEVKTGARPDFNKAGQQAKELKRYLQKDILAPQTLAARIYRSLFIRQVLIQVEKFKLYDVLEDSHLEELLGRREWWLKGDYQIADLVDYVDGMVLAHVDSKTCTGPAYKTTDEDILQIELPYSILEDLIAVETNEALDKLVDSCSIPSAYLLKASGSIINEEIERVTVEKDLSGVNVNSDSDRSAYVTDRGKEQEQEQEQPEDNDAPPESDEPLVVQFGHDAFRKKPVNWEPTNTSKVFNTNTGIIGTMGTGKTQFTKSVITQLVRNQSSNVGGEPIGMLIFDYKADYVKDDFIEATGAKVFDLFNLPFNPFSLFGDKPMLPVHTANLFKSTMGKAYGLGVKQQNKIKDLILDAYSHKGIHRANKATWTLDAPTLNDVWNLYEAEEPTQDSLHAALTDLVDFQIFEPDAAKTKSLYDILDGVVVINLSGYDPQIQNLVVAITLDIFYSQMHHQGSSKLDGDFRQISKMILVDEADNFMSQEFESLKKILKEGREFGVGTILSTQELTHFKTSGADYSSYILTWIIHRVSQLKNQDIRSIFNTTDKNDETSLMQQIRELDKHYSLYVDGEKHITKIKDLAFWEILL